MWFTNLVNSFSNSINASLVSPNIDGNNDDETFVDAATDIDVDDDADRYLDVFGLIWLDSNPQESRDTEQKLRFIINRLKKFQAIKQCQEYIEHRTDIDRLILITSGRLGREIVPAIHHLRQITSIYVYCMDKKANEEWASKFTKVKGVVVELDELISRITENHKIQKQLEEPLAINFSSTYTGGKSTMGLNGEFVFFQVLIDCLLRLKSNEIDTNELITICRSEYKGNLGELDNIYEFQNNYQSNKVLWWYTKESFFYRILNAALRIQDIHIMFLFRSFILNIQQELQKYQTNQSLKVYRGQIISSGELNHLKQSIDQFISINSFFSTSKSCSKAVSFLHAASISHGLENVLFEIEAKPQVHTTKPFADISQHSDCPDELEVLFMIGSIFRLKKICCDENQIWIIQMTLCNDDENELKAVLMYMKKQTGDGDTNLRILGNILWEMGKLDLAEKYFQRLLDELSSNDPSRRDLYRDLGKIASQKGDYDMSIKWHQKFLELYEQNQLSEKPEAQLTTSFIDMTCSLGIHVGIRSWIQEGVTVAGGNGGGKAFDQLYCPYGLYVDDDENIYIADHGNHRVVKWDMAATSSVIIVGGNSAGREDYQLHHPRIVLLDKNSNSILISDSSNKRVVRWPCQNGTAGEIVISNINCYGLAMDDNGYLYVVDQTKHEVRRWQIGDTNAEGVLIAGGHGKGNRLDQLNSPTYIHVDQEYSVYVSDTGNNRIMKWLKNATEGIIVAGGQGYGNGRHQLAKPGGIVVDQFGTIYIADYKNDRVVSWSKTARHGNIILGGNSYGDKSDQFYGPWSLTFDQRGNLYVVDFNNHRVQKFHPDLGSIAFT